MQSTPIENLSIIPANTSFDGRTPRVVCDDPNVLDRALVSDDFMKKNFDLIVIDTPPSLDYLLMNGLACADALMIPLVPHPLVLEGVQHLSRLLFRLAAIRTTEYRRIAVLPVMLDRRIDLHKKILSQAVSLYGGQRILRGIRSDISLAEAFSVGRPVRWYAPRSKGALDYYLLTEEVMTHWLTPFLSSSLSTDINDNLGVCV
ncbi:hypothetical protein CCP2SC5_710004 [Azospirillaceae bacterium]